MRSPSSTRIGCALSSNFPSSTDSLAPSAFSNAAVLSPCPSRGEFSVPSSCCPQTLPIGPKTAAASSSPTNSRTSGQSDRKSTRLNSSHLGISYAVFCLKKKKKTSTHRHTLQQIENTEVLY